MIKFVWHFVLETCWVSRIIIFTFLIIATNKCNQSSFKLIYQRWILSWDRKIEFLLSQTSFHQNSFVMLQLSLPILLIRFILSSKHMLVLSIMLHMSSFATTSSYATTSSSSVLLLRNEVRQLYEKMSSNG